MSLASAARAQAIYNAVQANNSNFGELSGAEQNALLGTIKTIFGDADLGYLIANTVVVPTALQTPPGGKVVTSGSPTSQTGSVISSVSVTGTGSIE